MLDRPERRLSRTTFDRGGHDESDHGNHRRCQRPHRPERLKRIRRFTLRQEQMMTTSTGTRAGAGVRIDPEG